MADISGIAETIGKARIARAVGRTPSAVSNALGRGFFPAYWRPAIEPLAREHGLNLEDGHFYSLDMAKPHVNRRGASTSRAQGQAADLNEKGGAA